MANEIVTLAGATGDLGGRMAAALARRGASVRALLRAAEAARVPRFIPSEVALQGWLDDLADRIRTMRAADPASEPRVFPPFQGMQYLHNMFSDKGKLEPLHNDRYPDVRWTAIRSLLEQKKDQA
ncbi:MAG TPA: hypothetical protein VLA61_02130 [Ideonella sp.]|uniref:hypothetical protein n=1 Tax=Ideonella sp. TaxID=1929293 RepID=UPI002B7382AB|nr:hypothetical protein [Ideonella sp.]HSI47049.1 hypothetical protein [Ideonella sp.]